jgi:hypothetical protein
VARILHDMCKLITHALKLIFFAGADIVMVAVTNETAKGSKSCAVLGSEKHPLLSLQVRT